MTAIIGFAAFIVITVLTIGFAIYLIWLPKPPTRKTEARHTDES